jgi:threonine dehydrogenase-like Zn-dependent dehydrogenase
MLPGDLLGQEMIGEVVEVGSGVEGKLKKGDRTVVPFII